ncbi:MAG: TIGR04282 family arsenosugar biosynthesis glycosyltransferase [Nitrospirota bacterium]|nr:TIGR04282 family arsenosugar biosynthesis glycosyltransferase [Nitrospirota bacterium]
MGTRLIIFAREPEPGAVKTRLIPALGADGAAALYAAFVTDMVTRMARRFETVLSVAPGPRGTPFLHQLAADTGVTLVDQPGGDLGDRMAEALHRELSTGAGAALLIGTDLPTLPEAHLLEAETRLQHHPLVFGPASDGGYWLAGASAAARTRWHRAVSPLFAPGIPWSTGTVLRDTLRRATTLRPALAPCWYDVDDPHDLPRLLRWLRQAPPEALPATRAALAAHPPTGRREAAA